MSSKQKKTNNYQGFTVSYPPVVTERGPKFRISPLAVIDHVSGQPDRELVKTVSDFSVEYRVRSGVDYDEKDPTQKRWEAEYGIECFEDGLVRTFVEYDPINSTKESAETTIFESVFPKLKERTLEYYADRGLEAAAEELELRG